MPAMKTGRLLTVGKKIKKVRTEKKMTHAALAEKTGLSVDYLKHVEAGKATPPVGTLLQISRAFEMDSGDLLKEEAVRIKDRIAAHTKRTADYAYTTLSPGAKNKHLKAFRVKIEAMKAHEGVSYKHEGEEFVYVLIGDIEVTVGKESHTLGSGDSLHFDSGIRHLVKNIGRNDAELIVVIYNP